MTNLHSRIICSVILCFGCAMVSCVAVDDLADNDESDSVGAASSGDVPFSLSFRLPAKAGVVDPEASITGKWNASTRLPTITGLKLLNKDVVVAEAKIDEQQPTPDVGTPLLSRFRALVFPLKITNPISFKAGAGKSYFLDWNVGLDLAVFGHPCTELTAVKKKCIPNPLLVEGWARMMFFLPGMDHPEGYAYPTLSIGTGAPAIPSFGTWGDVNADGIVTTDDVAILKSHLDKTRIAPLMSMAQADVNLDGKVNSDDVKLIERAVAGELVLPYWGGTGRMLGQSCGSSSQCQSGHCSHANDSCAAGYCTKEDCNSACRFGNDKGECENALEGTDCGSVCFPYAEVLPGMASRLRTNKCDAKGACVTKWESCSSCESGVACTADATSQLYNLPDVYFAHGTVDTPIWKASLTNVVYDQKGRQLHGTFQTEQPKWTLGVIESDSEEAVRRNPITIHSSCDDINGTRDSNRGTIFSGSDSQLITVKLCDISKTKYIGLMPTSYKDVQVYMPLNTSDGVVEWLSEP